MYPDITLSDIYHARKVIAGKVLRTPLLRSFSLSRRFDADIFLKCENLQPTGAFKLRGAVNCIASLSNDALKRGVTTASTGNHGRAVALAAQELGAHATICLSSLVPENKVRAIEAMGADVRIIGHSQDDAFIEAHRLVREEGMTLIPPFDDSLIIAGQGTIGLELMEDQPDLDGVLIGLSGGGLLAGIGCATKRINPACKVIGVSMQVGAAMIESLKAGKPVDVTEEATLADSLGGGIGLDNRYTYSLVKQVMDDGYQVSERAIARAMLHFLDEEKMLVEGAAAVGLAALKEHSLDIRGKRIALILSGNNVDASVINEIRLLAQ